MKKIYLIAGFALVLVSACKKLDLSPPDVPSTESFYSNQTELELAVNDLYRQVFWTPDKESTGAFEEFFTDNCFYRGSLGNSVVLGTMNSEDGNVQTYWTNCYKAIARVNAFIANKGKAADNTPASVITRLEAEMRLIRAFEYGNLINHFGDVPFVTTPLSLEEAAKQTRSPKDDIYKFVMAEFDFAAQNLPQAYAASAVKRLTKGAALALKARFALYNADWATARTAAQAVMQLTGSGSYTLNASYATLFQKAGEQSTEIIFSIPREEAQKVVATPTDILTRLAGGFGATIPTRELVDAYECRDGLPIDESPLYNPLRPFANRDPRLSATVVEFGTQWLGYSYQPHPDSLTVFSSKQNRRVANNDSRAVAPFASFTGFVWKKGVEQSWSDKLTEDNDAIIIRFAEVLLTYAEAKLELGELDASVLEALNRVRARAYGVATSQTMAYPVVTTLNATDLRRIIRRERRVEFAFEGLRYMDLIRWKLAEKALTRPVIGLPDPARQNRAKWPFPGVTPLDDDSIADYTSFAADVKILAQRNFDKNRQYLWPIPALERRVNSNLTQNPGY